MEIERSGFLFWYPVFCALCCGVIVGVGIYKLLQKLFG